MAGIATFTKTHHNMSEINYSALKSYGETPIEKKLNGLVDVVQSITITNHPCIHDQAQCYCGTSIIPKLPIINSPFPFKMITANDTDGAKVKILYGQVNSTPPDEMTGLDSYTMSLSDSSYIWRYRVTCSQIYLTLVYQADRSSRLPPAHSAVYRAEYHLKRKSW